MTDMRGANTSLASKRLPNPFSPIVDHSLSFWFSSRFSWINVGGDSTSFPFFGKLFVYLNILFRCLVVVHVATPKKVKLSNKWSLNSPFSRFTHATLGLWLTWQCFNKVWVNFVNVMLGLQLARIHKVYHKTKIF